MPTIAEQVATLERDYADALAEIDAQKATIEKLTLSLATMAKEKLELQKHEEETIAAVEVLARSALDMVRTAQRPAGTPAAVVPFAPKRLIAADLSVSSAGLANVPIADPPKPESPQQSAMAKDSAGEPTGRGAPAAFSLPPITARRPVPCGQPEPAHDERELPMFLRQGTRFDARAKISGASTIGASASAVDRIKRHLLPALTLMRGPPANAPRNDDALPMHIRRETVFARAALQG